MPGGDNDPIAEDSATNEPPTSRAALDAIAEGAGGGGGKPKLTKEQIAAVSADIAAVTKTMQDQLAAISQEVNALKGQIDGGAVSAREPIFICVHVRWSE